MPLMHRDPTGKIIPIVVAGAVVVVVLILTSPENVNAPGPGDPVYRPENPVILNAAGAAVGGAILSSACKMLGPTLGRIFSNSAGDLAGDAASNVGNSFRPFTKGNFRSNLVELTGDNPAMSDAHHVFPQKFGPRFQDAGIDIHDPQFGSWWETAAHQHHSFGYNAEWEEFLLNQPNQQQMLDFGRSIMDRHGLSVYF